ncbi:hypothetical protein AAH119_02210, partial [Bacteroides thetaiotaomicron]
DRFINWNTNLITCQSDYYQAPIMGAPKEYKEKFRTEHSTATVERNPQEKGKFRLCIDGIPILDWFRKKFQEIKEKLGLNTPVENKQRKGLKI